jgi:hypothetical protein
VRGGKVAPGERILWVKLHGPGELRDRRVDPAFEEVDDRISSEAFRGDFLLQGASVDSGGALHGVVEGRPGAWLRRAKAGSAHETPVSRTYRRQRGGQGLS